MRAVAFGTGFASAPDLVVADDTPGFTGGATSRAAVGGCNDDDPVCADGVDCADGADCADDADCPGSGAWPGCAPCAGPADLASERGAGSGGALSLAGMSSFGSWRAERGSESSSMGT